MSSRDWTIELPETWQTAPFRPGFIKVIGEAQLPRGRSALLVMGLLKDATNVVALTWDRGARLARVSPDTGWALEERFTGRPPGPGEGILIKLWKIGIDAMVHAGQQTRIDMADPDFEPGPAAYCLSNDDALDKAYEMYCESGAPHVTREAFELGVELLAVDELESKRGSDT